MRVVCGHHGGGAVLSAGTFDPGGQGAIAAPCMRNLCSVGAGNRRDRQRGVRRLATRAATGGQPRAGCLSAGGGRMCCLQTEQTGQGSEQLRTAWPGGRSQAGSRWRHRAVASSARGVLPSCRGVEVGACAPEQQFGESITSPGEGVGRTRGLCRGGGRAPQHQRRSGQAPQQQQGLRNGEAPGSGRRARRSQGAGPIQQLPRRAIASGRLCSLVAKAGGLRLQRRSFREMGAPWCHAGASQLGTRLPQARVRAIKGRQPPCGRRGRRAGGTPTGGRGAPQGEGSV